jgi:hypothetical protein
MPGYDARRMFCQARPLRRSLTTCSETASRSGQSATDAIVLKNAWQASRKPLTSSTD